MIAADPTGFIIVALVLISIASLVIVDRWRKKGRQKKNKNSQENTKAQKKRARKSKGVRRKGEATEPNSLGQYSQPLTPTNPYAEALLEYEYCTMDLTMGMLNTASKMDEVARRNRRQQYSWQDPNWRG